MIAGKITPFDDILIMQYTRTGPIGCGQELNYGLRIRTDLKVEDKN